MGRETVAYILALDWTPILVAIITAVATIANGLGIAWVYTRIRTPSSGKPGEAIEKSLQTGYANNALLTLLLQEHGIDVPDQDA